jgi:hypothetical protein
MEKRYSRSRIMKSIGFDEAQDIKMRASRILRTSICGLEQQDAEEISPYGVHTGFFVAKVSQWHRGCLTANYTGAPGAHVIRVGASSIKALVTMPGKVR